MWGPDEIKVANVKKRKPSSAKIIKLFLADYTMDQVAVQLDIYRWYVEEVLRRALNKGRPPLAPRVIKRPKGVKR